MPIGHTNTSRLDISITREVRISEVRLYGTEVCFGHGFLGVIQDIQAYLYCANHLLTL